MKNICKQIPEINKCKQMMQSISMLDAILSPEFEYRYYSFNSKWDEDEGQMMCNMKDGEGDEFFALFTNDGLIIKGFESESKEGRSFLETEEEDETIFEGMPDEFEYFLEEPAFDIESTFCIWNLASEGVWKSGKDYDKDSLYLLNILNATYEDYATWAEEYYEIDIDRDIVKAIFNFEILTPDMVYRLNEEIEDIEEILEDIEEIGYPFQNN